MTKQPNIVPVSQPYRNYFAMPGVPHNLRKPEPEYVIDTVCRYFEVEKSKIISHRRIQPYMLYRQIIQYLLYELTGLSQLEVAKLTCVKNHSSVYYSVKTINADMEVNPKVKKHINGIKMRLG
jgi:chromosomal replication initiator protein